VARASSVGPAATWVGRRDVLTHPFTAPFPRRWMINHQGDPATEKLTGTDFGCGGTTPTASSGRRALRCSLRLRW
jgi:hypothetical protein